MGKVIGEGIRPLICTPLVGDSEKSVLDQLFQVIGKQPDVIEWRADFFGQISDTKAVIALTNQIKQISKDIPLIFTIRSVREGGSHIPLNDAEAMALNAEICRQTNAEYVDCELSNDPAHIQTLRKASAENGTKIIASYHNFHFTPDREKIIQKFVEAERYQMDVAKVAVMPQSLEDVLALLSVTLEAKARFKMPLITMAMGKYGAISRMVGGCFGSSLTFAVGAKSSAPGQVPIEDLKAVIEIIERTTMGEL